jgi:biopolymer transport protein ExbD
LPETGLSRASRWCLAGSFLLILAYFVGDGIWWPVWRIAEITGTNPRIDPPLSIMADRDHGERDRMILTMDRDARLWRRETPFDSAGLEAGIREAILGHDRRCRMEGRSSTQDIGAGVRATKLDLVLRVDRAAPWGAVHDVMRRAGEEGICRIGFLARPPDVWVSKWLWAHLPWKGEQRAAIAIGVRRGPDGAAVYSLSGAEAPDPAAFRDRLSALYKQALDSEPEQRVVGRIDASRDVPFEAVVRALDAFALAGYWSRVDLEADGRRAEVR